MSNPVEHAKKYTAQCSPSQAKKLTVQVSNRHYISRQRFIGDPKDPFDVLKIQSELQKRLRPVSDINKTYPRQYSTSLCGPAAFFYCLLIDNPNLYEKYVWDLYYYGKASINNLLIEPSLESKRPIDMFSNDCTVKRITGLDWITLSSIRDSSNKFFNHDSIDDRVSGITLTSDLKLWFKKSGFNIFDLQGINKEAKIYFLNNYARQPNYHIVSLVNSSFLKDGSKTLSFIPNHWIVWRDCLRQSDGRIIDDQTNNSDFISLDLFTWGDVGTDLIKPHITYGDFKNHFHDAIIVKKMGSN